MDIFYSKVGCEELTFVTDFSIVNYDSIRRRQVNSRRLPRV